MGRGRREKGRKEGRDRFEIRLAPPLVVSLDASKDTRNMSDNDGGEIFYANAYRTNIDC